jgi:hypothetical protein
MNEPSKPQSATPSGANFDRSHAAGTTPDAGRTVLVGVLGGILSAAGYLVYTRLPDEQKDRLHRQVRGMLESRINELRSNFNL